MTPDLHFLLTSSILSTIKIQIGVVLELFLNVSKRRTRSSPSLTAQIPFPAVLNTGLQDFKLLEASSNNHKETIITLLKKNVNCVYTFLETMR